MTWECLCKCGKIVIVSGHHLRTGGTKSCGCSKTSFGEQNITEYLKTNNISFISQKQFEDIKSLKFDFFIENKYLIEFDGK
jgi:hypothetical protein